MGPACGGPRPVPQPLGRTERSVSPATITLAGARGGHGTTTVATALAILAAGHGPTRLVSADAAALLGLPVVPDTPVPVMEHLTVAPPGFPEVAEPGITVVDAGPLGAVADAGDAPLVVLRGPCYLGLRQLVSRGDLHRPGSS